MIFSRISLITILSTGLISCQSSRPESIYDLSALRGCYKTIGASVLAIRSHAKIVNTYDPDMFDGIPARVGTMRAGDVFRIQSVGYGFTHSKGDCIEATAVILSGASAGMEINISRCSSGQAWIALEKMADGRRQGSIWSEMAMPVSCPAQ